MESRKTTIRNLIIGAVLGITSMLPGISGATMAVVFGIYERLIRDLADLKTYLVKDFGFILTIGIGGIIGMLICAKILDGVLETYPLICLMFFIGLIAGQLPSLYKSVNRENGGNNYSRKDIVSFLVGLLLMAVMVVFTLTSSSKDVVIEHDAYGLILMFLVGVIVAVSAILPGLSHSTILLVFGLMNAFLAAISDVDIFLLAPILLGAVVGAIGFAKLFQKALERNHLTAMMFIIGLTIGSVAVIAANASTYSSSVADIVVGLVLLAVGLFISIYSGWKDAAQN